MILNCKAFARHVANGEAVLRGGAFGQLLFWFHWSVCPFCRRYWREIREIGRIQREQSTLGNHPTIQLDALKDRLKRHLKTL